MLSAALLCYFAFLGIYLHYNDPSALPTPLAQLSTIGQRALTWTLLALSALPWLWLYRLEVGLALWIVVLSLISVVVVLIYPLAKVHLLATSKYLLAVLLGLVLLGEFHASGLL